MRGTVCAKESNNSTRVALLYSDESIPRFFSNIRGPYAFMLFRRSTGSLFFGRDFFGRHSLLVGPTSIRGMHNLVVVTSVTAPKSLKCHELPALGIFHMNLTEPILDELGLFKWDNLCGDELGKVCDWDVRVLGNISSPVTLPKTLSNVQMNDLERSVIELRTSEEALKQMLTTDVWRVCIDEFESILRKAVRTRVEKQPHLCSDCIKMSGHVQCPHAKTGVLFSGGLDSSVLVALVDDILKRDSEPINLLNVAFQLPDGSFDAPDRKTALQALEELRQRNPERKYNFLEINVTKKELETGGLTCRIFFISVGIIRFPFQAYIFSTRVSQLVEKGFVISFILPIRFSTMASVVPCGSQQGGTERRSAVTRNHSSDRAPELCS